MSVIAGIRGFANWDAQSAKGDSITPATSLGIVDNIRVEKQAGIQELNAVGSTQVVDLWESGIMANVSFEQTAVIDIGLLSELFRSNNTLNYLTFEVGDDTRSWIVRDCMLMQADLSLDARGLLRIGYRAVGGKIEAGYGGAHTMPDVDTTRPFRWYHGEWSRGEIASFRATYNNNIEELFVIAGPSTNRDPLRMWDYLIPRRIAVQGSVRAYNESGVNLQADDIPYADWTMVLTRSDSPTTLTITLTDAKFTDETFAIPADRDLEFDTPFRARNLSVSLA